MAEEEFVRNKKMGLIENMCLELGEIPYVSCLFPFC